MDVKKCRKCREEKTVNLFYKSSTSTDGFAQICSSCYRLNASDKSIEVKELELLLKQDEKVCSKCIQIKNKKYFGLKSSSSDGLRGECKECTAKYSKDNRDRIYERRRSKERKNFLKIIENLKENEVYCTSCISVKDKKNFRENGLRTEGKTGTCRDCTNKSRRKYVKNNLKKVREKQKEYRTKNSDRRRRYNKKYNKENKKRRAERSRKYRRQRYKKDRLYKTITKVRNSIYRYIRDKGYKKDCHTSQIIGIPYKELLEFLENNKYNFKVDDDNIDIDHIVPLSSAKSKEELYKLSHYTNLQLLPSQYNQHIKRDNPFDKGHFEEWLKENPQ